MSKFQPGDETFDDVTGHKLSRHGLTDEETEGHRVRTGLADETDETEGHRSFAGTADEADEAEGHRFRALAMTDETDETDETEGHRLPVRGAVTDEDEVEGHRFMAQGLPEDEDVEGHRIQGLPDTGDGERRPKVR